jgi:hypothetical protein
VNSESVIHPISNPGTWLCYFKIEHQSGEALSSDIRSEQIEEVISLDLLTLSGRETDKASYLFADPSFLVIVLCHHPR